MTTPATPARLIYATFPSLDEAHRTGRVLVEQQLAACINILPGMTSIYRWQGNVETASEVVMIIKTQSARVEAVIAEVKRLHSYSVPAIVVLPVEGGNAAFLEWIVQETEPA